jgi:hypothetical protein
LKCEGCSKSLDSGAMMKDNGKFTSLICRSCHVSNFQARWSEATWITMKSSEFFLFLSSFILFYFL